MTKKVLILGASGFLGKNVKERFFLDGKFEILSPSHFELDLKNYDQTEGYFAEQKPAIIINASGLCGGVLENATRPADFIFENTITSLNAIKAASVSQPEKFVNISSACSYPDTHTESGPSFEKLKPAELWNGRPHETHAPYGIAKRVSCEAAESFARQYDLKAINLILANLYGPGDKFDNPAAHAIPSIISRMSNAKENGDNSIIIYGNPNVTREFLYIKDAADAIFHLSLKYSDSKPLNVGSGETSTIDQISRQIADFIGFDGLLTYTQGNLSGQTFRALNLEKLQATGWRAKVGIKEGLKQTIQNYQETRRRVCA